MTKPDEALLWARENMAKWCEENDEHQLAQTYRSGAEDIRLIDEVRGYRAGAAASADREEELEARVAELEAALKPLAQCEIPGECPRLPDDHGCRYFFTFGEIRRARAVLKEPRND